MRREVRSRIAVRLGAVAGLVVVICTTWLVTDWIVALGRESEASRVIAELEKQTRTDAGIAKTLHEERDRRTEKSLSRQTRGRALAWVLLVAGGVVVAAGKWYATQRPRTTPSLEELVTMRFPPPKPVAGRLAGPSAPPDDRSEDSIDLGVVDELVARFGTGREAAIPILQGIQSHYRFLPDEALKRLCERTEVTPAQVAGTSSFYAQFRRSPVGRRVVRVCHGTACHVAGAEQITQELRRHLEIDPDEDTDPRRRFTIDNVACLGCCSLAPVMMIEEETAGHLTPASARGALDAAEQES